MPTSTLNHTVESLFEQQLDFLKDLVSVPSTREKEAPAQQLIATKMREMGAGVDCFKVELDKISHLPGFSPVTVSYENAINVVGTFGNINGPGRSLIMNGHIDVVPEGPLTQWTKPPYQPYVDSGRLYGRGSADMKAGLSAKVYALEALRQIGLQPNAPVYLQSVVEEECTGNGALACLAAGYKADAALIGEPFNDLVRAQIGVIWFQVELFGEPAHALKAGNVGNVIECTGPLIAALRDYEEHRNRKSARHPAYADHDHPIHLNIGEIVGGNWTSSVPASVLLNLRIAIYPGEVIAESQAELEAWITQACEDIPALKACAPKISYHGFLAEGYYLDEGSDAENTLRESHFAIADRPLNAVPLTATTDARFFGLYQKTPTLVYGPRGENIHGFDEYVELDSLLEVTKVYANFVASWCGVCALDI